MQQSVIRWKRRWPVGRNINRQSGLVVLPHAPNRRAERAGERARARLVGRPRAAGTGGLRADMGRFTRRRLSRRPPEGAFPLTGPSRSYS